MTAREAYEAKKARLQDAEPVRAADPALASLIDTVEAVVNGTSNASFMDVFAMAEAIIEPK